MAFAKSDKGRAKLRCGKAALKCGLQRTLHEFSLSHPPCYACHLLCNGFRKLEKGKCLFFLIAFSKKKAEQSSCHAQGGCLRSNSLRFHRINAHSKLTH
jgi:hypothetical protein